MLRDVRAERDSALAKADQKEQTIQLYEHRDQRLVAAIHSLRETHAQEQEFQTLGLREIDGRDTAIAVAQVAQLVIG